MKGIPKRLPQYGEWYNWNPNPENNPAITVLQWYTTAGIFSNVPSSFPETWCREYGSGPKKGRMFYTGLSHQDSIFSAAWYRTMILNAMKWAAHDGETSVTRQDAPARKPFPALEGVLSTSGLKNRSGFYALNGRVMTLGHTSQMMVRKHLSGSNRLGVIVR
jgi:type 1 glutamine amidotransferase